MGSLSCGPLWYDGGLPATFHLLVRWKEQHLDTTYWLGLFDILCLPQMCEQDHGCVGFGA